MTTKVIKRHGVEWEFDDETWYGTMYERFHPMTWKFGDIWQCRINVDYEHLVEPEGWGIGNRICLEHTYSYDNSMKKAIAWVENYRENGLPGPEEAFRWAYDNFPSLNRRRIQVISSMFFTIGGNWNWLDGQICNESPEVEHFRKNRSDNFKLDMAEHYKMMMKTHELLKKHGEDEGNEKYEEYKRRYEEEILGQKLEENPQKYLPLPDDGEPYNFYPASESSNILCIPADVTDEWLTVCYEIVKIFTERNCNPRNKELQKTLLIDFESRYKDRLQRIL